MKAQSEKRLELLELVKNDKNKISVGKAVVVFSSVISQLDKHTKTFKKAKEKLGEDDYVAFLHAIINSYTSSLYVSASKNAKEQMKRRMIIEDANKDLLVKTVAVKKND